MDAIRTAYDVFRKQRDWDTVRQASPPPGSVRTMSDLFHDAILGVVVGDAVGVPFECGWRDRYTVTDMVGFEPGMPGYHKEPIPVGTWSDDSALTFATIDSYHVCCGWDSRDLLQRFSAWYDTGAYTPLDQNKRFGEGKTTVRAIEAYRAGTPADECGVAQDTALGNGSLMRILPLAFFPHSAADVARVSALTHAAPICRMACVCYVEIAEKLIEGADKFEAVRAQRYPQAEAFGRLADIAAYPRDAIRSSGQVIETLEAALWCFLTTDNYRDCILTAVNLGRDTDTVAAVAGGLAGIYYHGENGIPAQWVEKLQPGCEIYTHYEEKMFRVKYWNYAVRYEWMQRVLKNTADYFAQMIETIVPKEGTFRTASLSVRPGDSAKWRLMYQVEPDRASPQTRHLSVGVVAPPCDILVSNFLFKGTRDEVVDYLKTDYLTEMTPEQLQSLLDSLADKLDD